MEKAEQHSGEENYSYTLTLNNIRNTEASEKKSAGTDETARASVPESHPGSLPDETKEIKESAPEAKERASAAVSGPRPVLLKVENLELWFPSKKSFTGKPIDFIKAIDNISFEIYGGETLGLVGESGCGKTTLGRALLRLIDPTGGRILYRDKNLAGYSGAQLKAFRKNTQIIFQDPYSSLNPAIPVGKAIEEPMKIHRLYPTAKERRERTIALLEKVNLQADHYNRYPHEFSGGQRQRIVIARALASQPDFIVCDESVSALDVSIQAQVLNLLNDLKKELRFTSIFISHDLSVVRYVSDRIMVMNKGKIEEIGEAEQVYRHPQKTYTRQLLEAIPGARLDPALERQ
ncbi:MAG: ABC transporter ATP-binding protein [Chitinophagaceae bacterium]|nr:ABC transporter ATP-binding protein [Chitinophagaceae bacterium]